MQRPPFLRTPPQAARQPPRKPLAAAPLALIAWWCLALAGCGAPHPRAATEVLRIASYAWPGSYWIDVAVAKGWFEDEGLSVAVTNAHDRYFETLDEAASGQVDAMGFSQFDLVRKVSEGHDLVGVVATDYSDGAEALVARSGIRSLRDLRGRRIALPRGTYVEYLLSVFAEREGIELSDFTLVNRTKMSAIEDFDAGQVDAMFIWGPQVERALAAGGTRLFSTSEFPGLTYTVLSLHRDYIQSHRREVAALLRVWRRAETFIREHPEESCGIVSRTYGMPVAAVRELMRTVRVLNLEDNDRAYSYAAGFESLHASWRRMNDFMLERGLVSARVDSPAHLDAEFLRPLQ